MLILNEYNFQQPFRNSQSIKVRKHKRLQDGTESISAYCIPMGIKWNVNLS